jgi:hypothetical protein
MHSSALTDQHEDCAMTDTDAGCWKTRHAAVVNFLSAMLSCAVDMLTPDQEYEEH